MMFCRLESRVAPTLTFGTATSRPPESARLALDAPAHSKRRLGVLGPKYRGLFRKGPLTGLLRARSLRAAPVSPVRLKDKINPKRDHCKQSILNKKVSQGMAFYM